MLVEQIKSIIASGQTVELKILSGSMLPLLPPDCMITISPIVGRQVERGEIVVYSRDDTLVAHRLLLPPPPGGRGPCFEKGDNNPHGQWINSRRIIGIVTRVVYDDGSNVDFQTPDSRHLATLTVSHSLRADIRTRVLFIPRRIRKWLLRI